MLKFLQSKKGSSVPGSFLMVILVSVMMLSAAAYFSYETTQYRFISITNKAMDQVLVSGYMSAEVRNQLYDDLKSIGMKDRNDVIITTVPASVAQGNANNLVPRGDTITMTVIYDNPHYLGSILQFIIPGTDPDKFIIGHKMEGMCERW